ncbi:MAG: PKD domain-containing protein, partial [Thermoplasmata archaeon]|nr:PKD domain-containing protein [Thermoplasmata archaeon]
MVHASATVGCLLALCLLAPLPGAAGFVPDVHAAVGLGIVANPTSGFAPLLVDFALISQNGTPPSVSWAFGDGSTLNGSGSAFDAPSHVYVENGEYLCTVTAHWPAGPLEATVPIQVFASNLSAMVVASPLNGTAPLTVQFNATPIGGTGTYLAYVWNFDDGGSGSGLDVRYTFELPGTYHVSFMVTDSSEHNASTSVA